MPVQTLAYKTDTDVVKDEAPNRYSRDDVTLAATAAVLQVGTVLARNASGVYAPVTAATTADAIGVLLETVPVRAAASRVVVLSRQAQVALQALVWPSGITATQNATGVLALENRGIVARTGV